jgi:hypothetical protein
MIVYALYSSYDNGCDVWNNLEDLYVSVELAEAALNKLNQANEDVERQSYSVQALPVIEK